MRHIKLWEKITSPRSIAYFIKAFVAWDAAYPSDEIKAYVDRMADTLVSMFDGNSSADWKWFEDILAYSNAVMPDALIDAYTLLKKENYLNVARLTLDFLVEHSFEGTVCVPVGQSGWHKKGEERYRHDQQPEEVSVLVFALKAMHRITGEEKYEKMRPHAFNWFLGTNRLHQIVYNPITGGCYDGLEETHVNLNQGAESTLSYLMARLTIESCKDEF